MIASETIAASEHEAAERVLARFVALAYLSDHPDVATDRTNARPGVTVPSSSVVPFVAPDGLHDRGDTT